MEHAAQGRGLGRHLMRALERVAFEHEVAAVLLTVFRANQAGRRRWLARAHAHALRWRRLAAHALDRVLWPSTRHSATRWTARRPTMRTT